MSEIFFFEPKGPFYLNTLSKDVPNNIKKLKMLNLSGYAAIGFFEKTKKRPLKF